MALGEQQVLKPILAAFLSLEDHGTVKLKQTVSIFLWFFGFVLIWSVSWRWWEYPWFELKTKNFCEKCQKLKGGLWKVILTDMIELWDPSCVERSDKSTRKSSHSNTKC